MCNACKKELTKGELIDYINNSENGLSQIKNEGQYRMQLRYQPKQLLYKNITQDNEGLEFFVFTISDNGQEILTRFVGSKELFGEMSDQLNFYMTDKIFLKVNNKEIKVFSCFHQATYGMADKTSFIISFRKSDIVNVPDMQIVIKEFGLGIGDQKFTLEYNKIKEIATINILEDEETKKL
ncbi:MAG: hypothetical protein A3K10_07215 [Bacteroidetes bacterium RIFCSPLOWO2_12_FULL_31_6]|nr:MAG: hypothetical protein A3K10_07215 [Bacteroidetes bacterium RIFCSPLOWO2_12_FULL_31_6]